MFFKFCQSATKNAHRDAFGERQDGCHTKPLLGPLELMRTHFGATGGGGKLGLVLSYLARPAR